MRNLIIDGLRKPDGSYLVGEELTITLVDSLGACVSTVDLDTPGIYTGGLTVITDTAGSAVQALWPNEDSDNKLTFYHIISKNYTGVEYVVWVPSGTDDITLTYLLTSGIAAAPEHEEIIGDLIDRLLKPWVDQIVAFQALTASADTVISSEPADAEYDVATNNLHFNIPAGASGAPGDKPIIEFEISPDGDLYYTIEYESSYIDGIGDY